MQPGPANAPAALFEAGQVLFGIAGTLLYHDPTSLVTDDLVAERDTLLDPAIQKLVPAGALALHAALANSTKQRSLLLQDFTALFIQRTVSKVYPWESVYTTKDHTLFGPSTLEVQDLYRSYGIQLGASENEPPDHIGLELMFLSLLSQRGGDAVGHRDGAEAARFAKAHFDFLTQHVLVFANDFLDAMESKAQTDFYLAVCLFARETLAWAKQAFSPHENQEATG